MTYIPPLDYGFLLLENKESPNHVGSVEIMRPPKGASADYVKQFAAKLRQRKPFSPFNYKIKMKVPNLLGFVPGVPSGSVPIPQWRVTSSIDMDKHVLNHMLPAPGTKEQLMELLQELHEPMLKRDRPLWECHVIEGFENGQRFVVYTKIHHAIMDGMLGTTLLYRNSAITPSAEVGKAFWELPRGWTEPEVSEKRMGTVKDLLKSLVDSGALTKEMYKSVLHSGVGALRKGKDGSKHKSTRPFSAAPTIFDRKPEAARSFALGQVPLAQVKGLAKACGVSINDLLLAALDLAVRKFLTDAGDEVKKPLVALIPLSLRTEVLDASESNSVIILPVKLGRENDTFAERLSSIVKGTQVLKSARDDSGDRAMATTLMMVGLAQVGESLNLTGNIAPMGNFTFSNVMGPGEARYRFDAKIEEIYPLSVLSAGISMNVTSYSYAGQVNFQFVAMKKAASDLAPLMENLRSVLSEFEGVVSSALAAKEKAGEKAKKAKAVKKKKAVKKPAAETKEKANKKTTATGKTTAVKKTVAAKKTSVTKKSTVAKKPSASKKKMPAKKPTTAKKKTAS